MTARSRFGPEPPGASPLEPDATVWIASPPWPWTELAVRWHHRLVVIHPFRNGNGRWSRLAAETLLRSAGEPELSWGKASLGDDGLTRSRYLEALRLADAGELGPLVAFARS